MSKKLNYNEFIKLLSKFYQTNDGYTTYQPGEKETAGEKNIDLTYGEILPQSINTIIDTLDINENDIFYDLGSGTGKIPLQVFFTTPIKECYGIEAYKPRADIADKKYRLIKQEYKNFFNETTKLINIEDNFLTAKLHNPTIIFMDSLCFSEDTMKKISNKLNNLPTLKHIISIKKIQSDRFELQTTLKLESSWSKGIPTTSFSIFSCKRPG